MDKVITKILIDKIGRETVDRFIEDDEGNLTGIATISLEALAEKIADTLKKQGYGDIRQFVEKVKPIIEEIVELMFNDDEPNCKVDDCEKASDIPCGSSICIEENKQVWKDKIKRLLAEVIGE